MQTVANKTGHAGSNENCFSGRGMQAGALSAWIAVLAFFFACVEIQIEGGAGWAANLPTWRVGNHPLLNIFWGGKPLTGYHVWIFSFMALMFHMPIFMCGRFSLRLESRIIGSVMLFWIIEDLLWFVLNPHWGIGRLKPEFVSWHKAWILGLPVDYFIFGIVGGILVWLSFSKKRDVDRIEQNTR